MSIGIPYAPREITEAGTFVTCPECKMRIELLVRKDGESFSGIEYARHYEAAHAAPQQQDADTYRLLADLVLHWLVEIYTSDGVVVIRLVKSGEQYEYRRPLLEAAIRAAYAGEPTGPTGGQT